MEGRGEGQDIIDLSNQNLRRFPPPHVANNPDLCRATQIILNNTDLGKLENLANFPLVTHFSATHNKLFRMVAVSAFIHLETLDLSNNMIRLIEGVKDLMVLQNLNLSHNRIKEPDFAQFKTNSLKVLDLSHNLITNIGFKMDTLKELTTLHLNNNQINTLQNADTQLPPAIEVLSLHSNQLPDLSELNIIVNLPLVELTIMDNPCIDLSKLGDIYRPYVLNLFIHLQSCDFAPFTDVERAQADWLYSHGKGHQFRPGQHERLVAYLNTLGHGHGGLDENTVQRIVKKSKEMDSTFLPSLSSNEPPEPSPIMSRSLDPSILRGPREILSVSANLSRSLYSAGTSSQSDYVREDLAEPLPAASMLVPVPEALTSPMVTNVPVIPCLTPKEENAPDVYFPSEMKSTSKLVTAGDETLPHSKIKTIAEVARARKTHIEDRAKEASSLAAGSGEVKHPSTADVEKASTSHAFESAAKEASLLAAGSGEVKHASTAAVEKASSSHSFESAGDSSMSTVTSNEDSKSITPGLLSRTTSTISDFVFNIEEQLAQSETREAAANVIQTHWRAHRFIRYLQDDPQAALRRLQNHVENLNTEQRNIRFNDLPGLVSVLFKVIKLKMTATEKVWTKVIDIDQSLQNISSHTNERISKLEEACKEFEERAGQYDEMFSRVIQLESCVNELQTTITGLKRDVEGLKIKCGETGEMRNQGQQDSHESTLQMDASSSEEVALLSTRPCSLPLALSLFEPPQPQHEGEKELPHKPQEQSKDDDVKE